MSALAGSFRGGAAFLLLPLSLVPLFLALPKFTSNGQAMDPERVPLAAPSLDLSDAQLSRWRPLPAFDGAIPVLAYHGINGRFDHYSISRKTFAQQMEMLDRAGFETVSIAQYVRFLQGDVDGLPPRPILITFDDGRLDSYRGADKVLADHDFRATMFVIVGRVDSGGSFYLNWQELRMMAESGRWDLQEHSGVGHVNVVYNAAGDVGEAYAYRRYVKGLGLESFGDYRQRVREDILWGKTTMEQKIPGYTPWTFAVPYGNYGQNGTNDSRIPEFLNRFLRRNFLAVFLTRPPKFTTAFTPRGKIGRYEIHTVTSADRMYTWLRAGMPSKKSLRDAAEEQASAAVESAQIAAGVSGAGGPQKAEGGN